MPELSRREFAQLLGSSAAIAALPLKASPQKAVRLGANENPYGPSPAALQAMRDAFSVACRYPGAEESALVAEIAGLHRVPERQVLLGNGSSDIIRLAVAAFTGPQRAVVMADPTFELAGLHASAAGTEVRRVPLDASYALDAARMLEASRGAGLVYICNPNNPTATITPDKALRSFLASLPTDTVALVDEAYDHYATSSEYSSVIDLVAKRPNLIVSRTFSKIYGMAGLRCGYCIAQEPAISRLSAQQNFNNMNVMALVAARASLRDGQQVTESRRRNSDTRAWLRQNVERLGYRMLPSEANFVMIDTGRDVKPLITSMRANGVRVGRLFPAMPHHLRVTIGTPDEMRRFVEELGRIS
ncbi:MAG TPA: aminotransferase class I/II-fold pyridoxal phosphate-dependent enzyme [Thermoanaerobaculia bacterium]|nr:aminotransferase class I/II-fold pyridoxal phosphate-dependent enzyme [Thermoanaerobaculia bacterium]